MEISKKVAVSKIATFFCVFCKIFYSNYCKFKIFSHLCTMEDKKTGRFEPASKFRTSNHLSKWQIKEGEQVVKIPISSLWVFVPKSPKIGQHWDMFVQSDKTAIMKPIKGAYIVSSPRDLKKLEDTVS